MSELIEKYLNSLRGVLEKHGENGLNAYIVKITETELRFADDTILTKLAALYSAYNRIKPELK